MKWLNVTLHLVSEQNSEYCNFIKIDKVTNMQISVLGGGLVTVFDRQSQVPVFESRGCPWFFFAIFKSPFNRTWITMSIFQRFISGIV